MVYNCASGHFFPVHFIQVPSRKQSLKELGFNGMLALRLAGRRLVEVAVLARWMDVSASKALCTNPSPPARLAVTSVKENDSNVGSFDSKEVFKFTLPNVVLRIKGGLLGGVSVESSFLWFGMRIEKRVKMATLKVDILRWIVLICVVSFHKSLISLY